MNPKLYNELEELRVELARSREIIARLEARIRSLERENARLRKELEECAEKNKKIAKVIRRALELSDGKTNKLSYTDLLNILKSDGHKV